MRFHPMTTGLRHAHFLGLCALMGAWTAGCGKDKSDSADEDGTTELAGGGGDAECGGTPPVITAIQCSAAGLKAPEQDAEELPFLLMEMFIEDEDQDLNFMEVEIYFDDVVDGAVSTQDIVYPPIQIPLSQDECLDATATVNIDVFVNGTSPRFNSNYEWGVVIRDANRDASELFVFECITPYENGDSGTGGA